MSGPSATVPSTPVPLGGVVAVLGTTQILGYGTLYYSLAQLAGDMAASFDQPVSAVFAVFSGALLLSALVAPLVGRYIDSHGAGRVMSLGSLACAASLAGMALAPDFPLFAVGLCLTEVFSALVLYDAAFACLGQVAGAEARRRITHLTLIAGFASTITWPLTGALNGVLDWRQVMACFAVCHLLVCLPGHLWLARLGRRLAMAPAAEAPTAIETTLPDHLRLKAMWLVGIGFALSSFTLSAILAQMVPMLMALGLGASAVVVAMIFGPAQVMVRFVNLVAGGRQHPLTITFIATGVVPLSVLILGATMPAVAGAAVFALLLGFGSGLKSIVQGTLPLALFGRVGYGTRLGVLALARQGLTAAAPFALSLTLETFGPTTALSVMVATGVAGVLCFVAVARLKG